VQYKPPLLGFQASDHITAEFLAFVAAFERAIRKASPGWRVGGGVKFVGRAKNSLENEDFFLVMLG